MSIRVVKMPGLREHSSVSGNFAGGTALPILQRRTTSAGRPPDVVDQADGSQDQPQAAQVGRVLREGIVHALTLGCRAGIRPGPVGARNRPDVAGPTTESRTMQRTAVVESDAEVTRRALKDFGFNDEQAQAMIGLSGTAAERRVLEAAWPS